MPAKLSKYTGQPYWGAYLMQRHNARRRGIGFELTFPQWLGLWERSGKLDERGRGANRYCMARFGDAGPYAVGNVKIVTHSENSSESVGTKQNTGAAKAKRVASLRAYHAARTPAQRAAVTLKGARTRAGGSRLQAPPLR